MLKLRNIIIYIYDSKLCFLQMLPQFSLGAGHLMLYAVYPPHFDRLVDGILELNIQLYGACLILNSV
jgi:hypothetical protein